jgi:phytoene dehydrogenase-like protein
MIQALEKTILDNKGVIIKRTSLRRIDIQNCGVVAAKVERKNGSISTAKTRLLISDIGPVNTLKTIADENLKGDLRHLVGKITPVEGIKISIESNKPVLKRITGEEVGVIFTPSCKRVAGIAEPSSMDPDLAPQGKSLLMAVQGILSPDIKEEIRLGIKDLEKTIPDFNKDCRVLAIQVFKGNWPVNRARQGQDVPQKTPINGLYFVGDGAKPSGFIMAEGVVESARRAVEHILGM